MFAAIHPWLLWGAGAVAVPIAIHLLLRQRPRPRPWAAMRWLLAAMQRAQRRYKLTNLLLLLLRCLIVLLAALAVARVSLAGLGSGGRMVLIVDCTASMGARGGSAGPLAAAKTALADVALPARVTVVAVGARVQVAADGGAREALAALERLTADPIAGGLDRIATPPAADAVLAVCGADADAVLVSDFQQDDGELALAMLARRTRSVARWTVGEPAANAAVTGIEGLPDPLPGQPGELVLAALGQIGATRIAVDGGPFAPAGEGARVALPPLEAGEHRVAVEFADDGLAYDNRLELPLRVRGAVPVLIAHDRTDYLGAALLADDRHFAPRDRTRAVVRPAQLPIEPLPDGGVLALRGRSGDGRRIAQWVAAGGVLWSRLTDLQEDPALAPLVAGVALGEERPAAALRSGQADLDEVFATAVPTRAPRAATLPEGAEPVLWSGATVVATVLRHGRGAVVVELQDLAGEPSFEARGTTPLWVRRVLRRCLAQVDAPRLWEAGAAAPEAAVLRRAGQVETVAAGQPLLLPPGAWQAEDGAPVVVLPNRAEARLDKRPPAGAVRALPEAMPSRAGADWALPLLIAALLVLLAEGALAAWAGRTYGR